MSTTPDRAVRVPSEGVPRDRAARVPRGPAPADHPIRARIRVEGTVQGVGFRPFVYRLAHEEGLAGYVLNDDHGVVVEVEGGSADVQRFLSRLHTEAPPLARVQRLAREDLPAQGEPGFMIRASARTGRPDALIVPDTATCDECLAELRNPADRRYRYPFINCTNCGPRFTIVRGVPYDRPLTTMAAFTMCSDCRREYEDPGDRRFHAQPNACPHCGPHVRLLDAAGGRAHDVPDPVAAAAEALAGGAIVAVKGLGGYHLACDALAEDAVAALRSRKHREDKPFALMVADLDAAQRLADLGAEEVALLDSPARPIVLAPRRSGVGLRSGMSVPSGVGSGMGVRSGMGSGMSVRSGVGAPAAVAAAVAPGAPELGLMLPYTPLHHLLLGDLADRRPGGPVALVLTSGNLSDEPIAFRDDDALARLSTVADLVLVHDRGIATRTDDSVVRVITVGGRRAPLPVRRSRGYVPTALDLPVPAARDILGCGAEQKNTFTVAKATRAWVGHHIGDLEHFATHTAFREGISHFERLFAIVPAVVAHDLHPGYLSTTYALERDGVELVGVQHHHAHLAACLAEHGEAGPAVGAIFDGTGYGEDGIVWGGELLVGDLLGYERVGALRPVPLPGGTAAIREPWRMAHAWLTAALDAPPPLPVRLRDAVTEPNWRAMGGIAAAAELSPSTTSVGRLFDAVGALCGVRARVSYEGQAAVELEHAAARAGVGVPAYEIAVEDVDGRLCLDPRTAVRAMAGDLERGAAVAEVAAGFHRAVSEVARAGCRRIADARGLETVVLSGGVFQNRLLIEATAARLSADGLRVLIPRLLPPNDGGISFGQVAVAAAREARR